MTVKSGQSLAGSFVTRDSVGALSAATVGPVGYLYVNGVVNGATVTITGSNPYKFAVTLPTLAAGDKVDIYITATVDTVATGALVFSDMADTKLVSELHDITAADVWAVASRTLTDDRLNNLDVAVSTRTTLGAGAISWSYNIKDGLGNNIPDVSVWITSDSVGTNVLASGISDANGNVLFYLDAGTVYVWCQKSGYNFSNPDIEVVA